MAKVRKFADGGSDRYKARMERRNADIEKDYKIALAKGKNADIAKAKYERRKADVADDYAKQTKADRTATRAAESAAKSTLKEARRTDGRSIQMRDTLEKNSKPLEPKIDVASTLKGVNTTPLAKKAAPKATPKPAAKASTPKADTPATNTRAAMELRRTATRSQKAIREKRAENQADFRKRVQGQRKGSTGTGGSDGIISRINAGWAANKEKFAESQRKKYGTSGTSDDGGIFSGINAAWARNKEKFAKSQEAKYGKAKGGKVKKYAGGGSVPPQPTAAERAASKRQDESLKKAKVSTKEGRVISSANRSEGSGMMKKAKGGFMATKFGKALVKKSADTKGRAMVKKAGGGKCYAKGGSVSSRADGCAIKGKTKTKMV